jgi:hypothetical protein
MSWPWKRGICQLCSIRLELPKSYALLSVSLIFCCGNFFLKKITLETSLLRIHSSNGQMASSDHCYFDWACLSVTQSSNRWCDVGGTLLLGIQIIVPKSRSPLLPDRASLSITQCSNGYEVIGPLLLWIWSTVPHYWCISSNMPPTAAINAGPVVRSLSSNRLLSSSLNSLL